MADSSSSLVIISDRIIFNENYFTQFESFAPEDTKLLFTALFLNLIDNLMSDSSTSDLIIYSDENDSNSIKRALQQFQTEKIELFSYKNEPDLRSFSNRTNLYKHKILIYADVMGVSQSSINEILKLLSTDENTIVIGTSKNSSICLVGFNHQTDDLLNAIQYSKRDYSKLLSLLKTEEYFIHTLSGFVRVKDISSFKELYDDLSHKKSIEYCSQEMHEKFTHLFVEYKDLLK